MNKNTITELPSGDVLVNGIYYYGLVLGHLDKTASRMLIFFSKPGDDEIDCQNASNLFQVLTRKTDELKWAIYAGGETLYIEDSGLLTGDAITQEIRAIRHIRFGDEIRDWETPKRNLLGQAIGIERVLDGHYLVWNPGMEEAEYLLVQDGESRRKLLHYNSYKIIASCNQSLPPDSHRFYVNVNIKDTHIDSLTDEESENILCVAEMIRISRRRVQNSKGEC